MNLFYTTDVSRSIRKAHKDFTHIALTRAYDTARPVFYNSAEIVDMPLFQYASWIKACSSQLKAWEDKGGVLIEQDHSPKHDLRPDVATMVECPLKMSVLESRCIRSMEYSVIPKPMSWAQYDESINLSNPDIKVLDLIWPHARGQRITNNELAKLCDIPPANLRYLKSCLKPQSIWNIVKKFGPEREEFIPAWDWVRNGDIPKSEIALSGHKPYIEEMARFGYIQLKRYHQFPYDDPDWDLLKKKREKALKDLAEIRLLVESLPYHLEE